VFLQEVLFIKSRDKYCQYNKENVRFTTPIQQLHNNPSHEDESKNVRFTTPIQQLYNNYSHEGG
jgi:hypothetical protein